MLHRAQMAKVVLIGTKSDIRGKHGRDCISYEEGVQMAKRIGAVAYYDTSAIRGAAVLHR